MEQFKVIKTIVKGFSMDNPRRFSNKVIAKVGTILYAERDFNRLYAPVVLRKKNGQYVCDLGSHTANEHCEKIDLESWLIYKQNKHNLLRKKS